jgi:hypothetical protein
MRKRRGPYSDPRQGSILKQIDNCFTAHNTDTLDASVLMDTLHVLRTGSSKVKSNRDVLDG